jgi:hypothetical protein
MTIKGDAPTGQLMPVLHMPARFITFKTAFYKTVLERMIHGSVLVTAVDYRAPSRKRSI